MQRRVKDCPFCGREVRVDDEAQAVLHEEPVCERFDQLAHSVGETPEVKTLGGEAAIESHLGTLRERVRSKKN